mgnify:FL=1
MRFDKGIITGIFFLIGIVLLSNLFSAYMASNTQAFQFSTTGKIEFNQAMCQQGQDFIIQIAPFGCTPAVVRTDLLEENDVQVYCQLGATKINPLIEVEAIDSISFSGSYPKEVAGIGFHPAKAALGTQESLNTPILENIGYVVITLRKQANASAIPDVISGNLTAKISYNIKNAFGIGKALFYIPEFANDEEWEAKKYQYGFWGNKGYLKAEEISTDSASISVYSGDNKISTVNLKKGETSQSVYIPGFECQAGLKLKLESLDAADTRAQLRINAEVVGIAKDEKFLDNKCSVRNLVSNGLVQRVGLRCQEDTGAKNFDLTINPRIILSIDTDKKEVGLGKLLYKDGIRSVYLGYIGAKGTSSKENLFIYLVSMPNKNEDKLTESEISSITSLVKDLTSTEQGTKSGIIRGTEDWLKSVAGLSSIVGRFIASGQTFYRINFEDKNEKVFESQVFIADFAGAYDKELSGDLKEQYENAKKDYETIKESFSSESYQGTGTYGEEALYNEITLAFDAEQKKTVLDLCKEFSENYPNSKKDIKVCNDVSKLSSQETSGVYVTINKELKLISFDGISEPSFDDYGARIMASTPQGTKYFDLRKNQYKSETGFSLQLISAQETSARVQISVTGINKPKNEIVTLEKDITNNFAAGYSFTLTKINLKKIAKVSLIPNINNAGTQANFSFKVGIEKRAIQLSPEQIKKMIKNLDESMAKWKNISDTLGKVTQGLKTACLATGAALIVKNFWLNAGGAGIARQHVMRGANGWYERCKKENPQKIDACLTEHADEIDKEVKKLSNVIEEQNNWFKETEKSMTTPGILDSVVNTSKLMESYIPRVKTCLEGLDSTFIPTGKGTEINKEQLLTTLSYQGWKNGIYTREQLREIELFCIASKDSELSDLSKANLYSNLLDVQVSAGDYAKSLALSSKTGISPSKIGFIPLGKDVEKYDYVGLTGGELNKQIPAVGKDTPVYLAPASDGKTYLYVLDNTQKISELSIKNINNVKQVYDYDSGTLVTEENSQSYKELTNLYFVRKDTSFYNNKYDNPELRYYETEPYKGLPAIVPFDVNKGWYAAIKQTHPVPSNIA